jgi:Ca2+-binding EF-hand superfamily protein
VKQFKFFDIYNAGTLNFDNFYRTAEKVGIIKDKEEVYQYYQHLNGVDANGNIDYKTFSKSLFSDQNNQAQSRPGTTYSPSKKGTFDDNEENPQKHQMLSSGMNSQEYPLSTTAHFYTNSNSAGRKNVMHPDYLNKQVMESLDKTLNDPKYQSAQDSETESVYSNGPVMYNYGHEPEYYKHSQYSKKNAPKSQVLYVERFKDELHNRGGRGMIGLFKQFKLFDTDQSGYLDKYEFKKAVEDYEVNVHPKDLDNLFNSFDQDGNGKIEYNEFLQALAGPLTKFRLQMVERVFDKLDGDNEGQIDINDIFASFDPYRHPDVASGKNDPEGVFNEFKDSFEVYHNIIHDYNSGLKVSRDEFTDFYTFLSSQFENDAQFDIMINGVWNLDNKNNYEEMPYAGAPKKITKVDAHSQWLNDHHRRIIGGDDSIYHKGDVSWQTTHNTKYRTDIPAAKVTAGVPTWPVGAVNNWSGGQMHEDQRMDKYQEMNNYGNNSHTYSEDGNQY